ncbi:MAG TPA: hypothetical protein DCG47_01765 [Spirochaetaceae bacterium]|jgi:hypothetical protein|nr:hypothetical protein [Spirochaetaceae bacterium]
MRLGAYDRKETLKTFNALLAALGLVSLLLFSSCAATDVVARYAVSSFGKAVSVQNPTREGDTFRIVSPSGESLILALDLASSEDAILELDAGPFLEAGLDPALLRAGEQSAWAVEGSRLIGSFRLGSSASKASDPSSAMAEITRQARERIGYHAPLKHYGVMLSDEAMVEWAADLAQNDKDWVFILDPGFLRAAGTELSSVRGWALAMVPMEGPDGKMIEVEKLLKAFDLP